METPRLISTDEFCTHHKVEFSFINSLQQFGLIEITTIEETSYIHTESLTDLEKFARLRYELDINLEGIETITYLLQKIKNMQEEINRLKNKLTLYDEME